MSRLRIAIATISATAIITISTIATITNEKSVKNKKVTVTSINRIHLVPRINHNQRIIIAAMH